MLQIAAAGVAAADDASRPRLPLPLDHSRRRTPLWPIDPLLVSHRNPIPIALPNLLLMLILEAQLQLQLLLPRQRRRSQRNRTLSSVGTFSLAHAIPLRRGRLSSLHSVGCHLSSPFLSFPFRSASFSFRSVPVSYKLRVCTRKCNDSTGDFG